MIAWDLKQNRISDFTIIPAIIITSLFVNVLIGINILGWLTFSKKRRDDGKPEQKIPEKNILPREFIDPKLSAEKLFKNVHLKTSLRSFGKKLLGNISDDMEIMQGIFYIFSQTENIYEPVATYALTDNPHIRNFSPGDGITGEAVRKKEVTLVRDLPEGYRQIASGLGSRSPGFIYFIPLIYEDACLGLVEISTFKEFPENKLSALGYCIHLGGIKLRQFLEKMNE